MTARIVGFVTRAEAGLVKPNSYSRNISPERGGAAVHYGGPAQGIDNHPECLGVWRGWQRFHLGKGWADIAYTGGFCDHGYALAGRGHGVRTAANGTNDGNQRFHAYVWLGGKGETPTELALDALDWWLQEGRTTGGNGLQVIEHKVFTGTECPGPSLIERARARNGKPIPPPSQPAETVEFDMARLPVLQPGAKGFHVMLMQKALECHTHDLSQEGGADGVHGPGSQRELNSFKAARGLPGNGVVDQPTWGFLLGAR